MVPVTAGDNALGAPKPPTKAPSAQGEYKIVNVGAMTVLMAGEIIIPFVETDLYDAGSHH